MSLHRWLAVPCTFCDAPAGENCRIADGRVTYPHDTRVIAASLAEQAASPRDQRA